MNENSFKKELLPNFLIVGAAKAATTTIHEYLKQHPNVFMTKRKEPCFFTFRNTTPKTYSTGRQVNFYSKLNDYQKLFDGSREFKIKGESSTPYLYFYEKTIKNIKEVIDKHGGLKILIVLRNPIDRAYSQYSMKVRDGVEEMSFENAIKIEKKRMQENAHFDFFYLDRGLYFKQVKGYLENFKNVKIILFEDFKNNENLVLNDISDFLEVEQFKYSKLNKLNISGTSKIRFITKIIKGDFFVVRKVLGFFIPNRNKKQLINYLQRKNTKKGVPICENTKNELKDFYKKDIIKLERLINRDLAHWYN